MVCVFVDDCFYVASGGEVKAYHWDEMRALNINAGKDIAAAFMDCAIEPLIANGAHTFSSEYIVEIERLVPHGGQTIGAPVGQAIGAHAQMIERFYGAFNPSYAGTLVPYPIAIRAYLKHKSILPEDKLVVFIDELDGHAFVTIFDGMRFTAPRRLNVENAKEMTAEIRRCVHSYRGQSKVTTKSLIIISTKSQWLEDFVQEGLVSREDTIAVNDVYPVLDGLRLAKFNVHFRLPQDIARRKKHARMTHRLSTVLGGAAMILAGGIAYAAAFIYSKQCTQTYDHLLARQKDVVHDLENTHKRKFLNIWAKEKHMAFDRLYYDFITRVPEGYVIKEFSFVFTSPDQWQFVGLIYPVSGNVPIKNFYLHGAFEHATIENKTVNKALGQYIRLNMNIT